MSFTLGVNEHPAKVSRKMNQFASEIRVIREFPLLRPVQPLPPLLLLPLAHKHGGQHGYHHGDGDDEHGDGLSNAQLGVHLHQPVVVQDGRLPAGQVVVVVQEDPLDAAQLPENPLQLAVAVPGVSLQQDVGAVGVDVQEGLEADGGQLVVCQVQ